MHDLRSSLTGPIVLLVVLLALAGCGSSSDEAGSDASDVASADASIDTSVETSGADSAEPELVTFGWPEACEDCMSERCWGATKGCGDDAGCAGEVSCDASCRAPSCLATCWNPPGGGSGACVDDGTTYPYNEASDDYWDCLWDECEEACGMGSTWACVGDYDWPAPDVQGVDSVAITYHAVDFINPGKGVEGATVSACERADVDCAAPVATATTDADGYACMDLPVSAEAAFTGFFRFSHEDYVTIDDQYGRPIYYGMSVYMAAISTAANDMFFTSEGVDLDPARGLVTVEAFDCTWNSAPGVVLELSTADAECAPFYVTNHGSFSFDLTQTTGYGTGAFVNAPAGAAHIIARLAEGGEAVGCHDVHVHPGVRTHLRLSPFYQGAFGCPDGLP